MSTEAVTVEGIASVEPNDGIQQSDVCPICHLVENPHSLEWICCDECQLWYHDVCEGITTPYVEKQYVCSSCRKKRRQYKQQ